MLVPGVQAIALPCSEILPHKSVKKERHHDFYHLPSMLHELAFCGREIVFESLVTSLAYNIVGNR